MGKILNVSRKSFTEEILNSKEVVLVDFWADWCGPCKMLVPILEEIGDEKKVKICKINTDDEFDLATKFDIKSIPTIVVFKNGKEIDRIIGLRQKEELIEKIKSY